MSVNRLREGTAPVKHTNGVVGTQRNAEILGVSVNAITPPHHPDTPRSRMGISTGTPDAISTALAIRMPLKTEPLEEPSINLTSMLDVVMLLIIFFMVGTKFSEEERQTGIQLPSVAENFALSGQPDEIVVNVDADGKVQVKNEKLNEDELKILLEAARFAYANQSVVIRGDGRCEYQKVMDVFSTCKEAGIKNVSVAHVPKPKGI